MQNAWEFCTILTTSGVCGQIFVYVLNTTFHWNPVKGSGADACGQTEVDGETDWLFANLWTRLKYMLEFWVAKFVSVSSVRNRQANQINWVGLECWQKTFSKFCSCAITSITALISTT